MATRCQVGGGERERRAGALGLAVSGRLGTRHCRAPAATAKRGAGGQRRADVAASLAGADTATSGERVGGGANLAS